MTHHGEALRALTSDAQLVDALKADPAAATVPPRSRALVDYAVKLTRVPYEMTADDLLPLRASGLSDAAIHDAAAIAAYFNLVNRLALGLGVELEQQGAGPGSPLAS